MAVSEVGWPDRWGLVVILLSAGVALTVLTHDLWPTNDGLSLLLMLVFAAVGLIVASRQPHNAVGWILVGVAVLVLFQIDASLYLVLDYRLRHGHLPFGAAAAYWVVGYTLLPILFGLPAILLFPDGRLSRRWRRVLWAYLTLAVIFSAAEFVEKALPSGQLVQVNMRGKPTNIDKSTVAGIAWVLVPLFLLAWGSFVGRQVVRWRRSGGEQREQLKWLMMGSAICVISSIAIVVGGDPTTGTARMVADLSTIGIGALPISIGIGILKYRLYEIDRLISRTLSYTTLTGLLAGVFFSLVILTTRVLPLSSPIGVAASTLTAAALFNPLRTRIQHTVDHRFNRAHYDAEATLTAFTHRLRDAVDLDTIQHELVDTVTRAVQPTHTSIWIKPHA